jgi:TonB family protein
MVAGVSAPAQSVGDWQSRLVEHPLYLRGFWQENTLEFDALGKPMKPAHPGPLTLSGMDVTSVSIKGKEMTIRGHRVALVATASGRLERQTPESSTGIAFSLRKNNVFKAKEEMKVTIHADTQGSFEGPVKAVFADGLKEFSTSVPEYWSCYAQGYLAQDVPDQEAARTTSACLKTMGMDDEVLTSGDFRPPQLGTMPQLHFPPEVFELGLSGRCVARVLIGKDGVPRALQVLRPVGAGLDEELLQAESRAQYRPATIDGVAVTAAIDVPIDVVTKQD